MCSDMMGPSLLGNPSKYYPSPMLNLQHLNYVAFKAVSVVVVVVEEEVVV